MEYKITNELREKLLKLNLTIIGKSESKNRYILKDTDDYKYFLSSSNVSVIYRRKGEPRKFFGGNPYTRENILNYILKNNINIQLLTTNFENITAITNLDFYCPIHGNFQKSWNSIKNSSYCPICGKLKGIDKKRNNIEDVKLAFEKENYTLISDKYINNLTPLQYICEKHKNKGIQQMAWGSFITGQRCLYCTKERLIKENTKSHEEFQKEVKSLYKNKFTLLTSYTGCKNKINIYCNDCHTEFIQAPNHLLEGHFGCNCKPTSLGEKRIKEILDKNNNTYMQQHRFNDCKNKKMLPFDFAIFEDKERTKLKYLIEYDGEQHFKPVTFGGISDELAYERFINTINNDIIKNIYCQNNNIELIRIPYYKFNDIEEILNNINNKLNEKKESI
jgi:hypothetical protein